MCSISRCGASSRIHFRCSRISRSGRHSPRRAQSRIFRESVVCVVPQLHHSGSCTVHMHMQICIIFILMLSCCFRSACIVHTCHEPTTCVYSHASLVIFREDEQAFRGVGLVLGCFLPAHPEFDLQSQRTQRMSKVIRSAPHKPHHRR